MGKMETVFLDAMPNVKDDFAEVGSSLVQKWYGAIRKAV